MGKSSKSDKKKEKESKKHAKKHKKAKSAKREASSSTSSSDADEVLTPRQQLARDKAAVVALRELLWLHAPARKELRDMLWTVDQGKAASIAGISDQGLRGRLRQLLKLLGLRGTGIKDVLALPKGAPATLSVLGFVFEEVPRCPPSLATPPVQAPAQAPAPAPAAAPAPAPAPAHAPVPLPTAPTQADLHPTSATGSSPCPSSDSCEAEPPLAAAAAAAAAAIPQRRVLGPALPSASQLAAAAAATAAVGREGWQEGVEEEEGEEEDDEEDLLVGPLPPELLDEMEGVAQDAREEEVLRVLRVLRDFRAAANQSAGQGGQIPGPASLPDAYAVLGIDPGAAAPDIKRRYMRLSLLIHPDKCQHKEAHAAFQAVTIAAKTLQDGGLRLALDAQREDAELRRRAVEVVQQQERERQWRVARGEEPAGPAIAMPGSQAGSQRESWMTELPPELGSAFGSAMMQQVSQRAFARFGKKARDADGWTDTPQQREARAQGALQQGAAGPLLLTGVKRAGPQGPGGGGPSASEAGLLDAFNAQTRKKTLLEEHLELQAKGPAKQAKLQTATPSAPGAAASTAQAGSGGPAWAGKHGWRPFDKDKDLVLQPKALDPAALLKNQGSLSTKFATSGSTRHFL